MLQFICQPRPWSSLSSAGLKYSLPSSLTGLQAGLGRVTPKITDIGPHQVGASISCLSVLETWRLIMSERPKQTEKGESQTGQETVSKEEPKPFRSLILEVTSQSPLLPAMVPPTLHGWRMHKA